MNESDRDPMLYGSAEESANYKSSVINLMLDTIKEDRAARRSQTPRPDAPATIIGAAGLSEGLTQSL